MLNSFNSPWLQCNHQTSTSSWCSHLASTTIRKTKRQKGHTQEFCSQNDKHSEQLLANSVWCLSCNLNLSAGNRNVHSPAWPVSGCETGSVPTQTQGVWHGGSGQERVPEDTQQAAAKKSSSAAATNADWRRGQDPVGGGMVERRAPGESTGTQGAAQQMKIVIRSREIWVKTARNQRIRACCNQAACSSSQDREHNNHSNKNRQNWAYSILESDISIRCRIFCLSMWMSEKNHSTHNSTLLLLHRSKISDNRFTHESSEYQRSHQQLRESMQTDQMIHSATDSAAV